MITPPSHPEMLSADVAWRSDRGCDQTAIVRSYRHGRLLVFSHLEISPPHIPTTEFGGVLIAKHGKTHHHAAI
jgi:hypothetical protein